MLPEVGLLYLRRQQLSLVLRLGRDERVDGRAVRGLRGGESSRRLCFLVSEVSGTQLLSLL